MKLTEQKDEIQGFEITYLVLRIAGGRTAPSYQARFQISLQRFPIIRLVLNLHLQSVH